jgi:hypothetical protein
MSFWKGEFEKFDIQAQAPEKQGHAGSHTDKFNWASGRRGGLSVLGNLLVIVGSLGNKVGFKFSGH